MEHIGNFEVTVDNEGKDTVLNVSQVVSFDFSCFKNQEVEFMVLNPYDYRWSTYILKSNINSTLNIKNYNLMKLFVQYNEEELKFAVRCWRGVSKCCYNKRW